MSANSPIDEVSLASTIRRSVNNGLNGTLNDDIGNIDETNNNNVSVNANQILSGSDDADIELQPLMLNNVIDNSISGVYHQTNHNFIDNQGSQADGNNGNNLGHYVTSNINRRQRTDNPSIQDIRDIIATECKWMETIVCIDFFIFMRYYDHTNMVRRVSGVHYFAYSNHFYVTMLSVVCYLTLTLSDNDVV